MKTNGLVVRLHVTVAQVSTVNGLNGQFAVPIVPVESLTACNITTVAPIQLSKNAHVVLIAGQDVECNTQRCCYNKPWTDWSPCSTTYGSSYQERAINGSGGLAVQIDRQRCTNAVILTEWSEWGAGSAECGNGFMTRTRSDPCRGI